MTDIYTLLKPLIFRLDPETAHNIVLKSVKLREILNLGKAVSCFDDGELTQKVAGLTFPNPIGLAAGFDKNAEIIKGLFGLGFGFVETGTVTPKPQFGNDRPRLFRLQEDKAIINRFGFNSKGLEYFTENLKKIRLQGLLLKDRTCGPIGGNVGANKNTKDKKQDYVTGIHQTGAFVDYITLNISSPNTPGLRDLQSDSELLPLLRHCHGARQSVEDKTAKSLPLFLKIAPDLSPDALKAIADITLNEKMDALILTNTTLERPAHLQSSLSREAGGLSGRPLKEMSFKTLECVARHTSGSLPLVSVGGIETAQDIRERLSGGASLVQLYSALVYEGPYLISRLLKDLMKETK